jgi:hypothetical protein
MLLCGSSACAFCAADRGCVVSTRPSLCPLGFPRREDASKARAKQAARLMRHVCDLSCEHKLRSRRVGKAQRAHASIAASDRSWARRYAPLPTLRHWVPALRRNARRCGLSGTRERVAMTRCARRPGPCRLNIRHHARWRRWTCLSQSGSMESIAAITAAKETPRPAPSRNRRRGGAPCSAGPGTAGDATAPLARSRRECSCLSRGGRPRSREMR